MDFVFVSNQQAMEELGDCVYLEVNLPCSCFFMHQLLVSLDASDLPEPNT